MHIVHWPKSGITTLVRGLIKYLDAQGTIHVVVFLEADVEIESEFKGYTPNVYSLQFGANKIRGLLRLRTIVSKFKPHIVHVHSFLPGFLAIFTSKKSKVVRTVHSVYPYFFDRGLRSKVKRAMEYITLLFADKIICVAEGVQHSLPWQSIKSRAFTIDNGFDVDWWSERVSAASRAEFGLLKNQLVFVSMGRLEHQKGFDILVDAFANVRKDVTNAALLIFGEGSQRSRLENRIRELNLGDVVLLPGFRQDARMYLRMCDIYVSSSRYEGFNLALGEAMVCGLPVVTTVTTGIAEKIESNKLGYVTPHIEAEYLANTMITAALDVEGRRLVASQGKKYTTEVYSLARMVDSYNAQYRSLLGGN